MYVDPPGHTGCRLLYHLVRHARQFLSCCSSTGPQPRHRASGGSSPEIKVPDIFSPSAPVPPGRQPRQAATSCAGLTGVQPFLTKPRRFLNPGPHNIPAMHIQRWQWWLLHGWIHGSRVPRIFGCDRVYRGVLIHTIHGRLPSPSLNDRPASGTWHRRRNMTHSPR